MADNNPPSVFKNWPIIVRFLSANENFQTWLKTLFVSWQNPVLRLVETTVYKMKTDLADEDNDKFQFVRGADDFVGSSRQQLSKY